MKKFSLVVLLMALTACSTITGIFSPNPSTNYNALTYGDDYAGNDAHKSWADPSDRAATNAATTPTAANDESRMRVASNQPADPTDDRVRDQVETGRGLAVAHYQRGDRATKVDFYDNAANDGSLWAKEDDSNYFFTKGKVHAAGDIISVKLEEPIIKQVAEEVKKGLTPAEQEVEMALYRKNNAAAKDDKDISAYRNIAEEDLRNSEAENIRDKMVKAVRWSQVDLSGALGLAPNEEMRAEIIERFSNGNYKIRAVKRILYRGSTKLVSMVAIAPVADLDEKDLIASGKLYEYKVKVAR